MRGGSRAGAGRPSLGTKEVAIRLKPEEHATLKAIGGSATIREILKSIREKKMTFELDTTKMTEEQQDQFIAGWEDAGGYTGDTESPAPWCAPWCSGETIEVTGDDAKDWGAQYWAQCKDEVERILAEEAEAADGE